MIIPLNSILSWRTNLILPRSALCLIILNEAQMKETIDKCYSDHEIRRLLFLCILIGFVAGFVIGFIVRWAVK